MSDLDRILKDLADAEEKYEKYFGVFPRMFTTEISYDDWTQMILDAIESDTPIVNPLKPGELS